MVFSQLEASSTENANEAAEIEAEVKKANRDLSQLLNTMEPHNSKLDAVQRKYTELLGEMKKVERPRPLWKEATLDKSRFYEFHDQPSHTTDACWDLRDAIEKFI